MEFILAAAGILGLYKLLLDKEDFTPTFLDSEQYHKQKVSAQDSQNANTFTPSQQPANGSIQTAYNNPHQSNFDTFYTLNNEADGSQQEWINKNSLYNQKKINGIPIKEYYDKYTKDVLDNGRWFLNKDMPEDTKQYLDNSQVQQRMEMFTGLRQKRDREDLGVPNRQESQNMFTPEEKITGYGYQYAQGSGGPGYNLTRQKELEDYKSTLRFKTNEQPIEKIHVGKGIALSPEVPAAGGFQEYTRIVPDNISDYSRNQLPGMVSGEKWMNNAPTSSQPVMKNRPNGYYSLCQYGPGPGRSTITAESIRPDFGVKLKNQNREFINYGFGAPLTNLS